MIPATTLHLHRFRTPLGTMALVHDGERLVRSYLPDTARGLAERFARDGLEAAVEASGASDLPRGLLGLPEVLAAYFDGAPVDPAALDLPLDHGVSTTFAEQVLEQLRTVPRGQTVSYGRLAASVGRPKAARAVGSVMARNRLPLIVPCHRVLAAQGLAGGFSGPRGLAGKRDLLALEGVELALQAAS